MIEGKRVLAVVPAWGGRNVPPLAVRAIQGMSLMGFTARTIRECGFIDGSIVCTDHPEISETARSLGMAVTLFQPERITGDNAMESAMLIHASREMEGQDDCAYDIVLLLRTSSPLRTPAHIREAAEKLVREGWDSILSLSPTDLKFHPLKQLRIDGNRMTLSDPRGKSIIARQQLEPVYFSNGIVSAFTRSCILGSAGMLVGAIVNNDPGLEIETLKDFERFEGILGGPAGAVFPEKT